MKNNVASAFETGSIPSPQVATVTPIKPGNRYHQSTEPNKRTWLRTRFNSARNDSTTVAPGGAGGVLRRVRTSFQAMKIAPPVTIHTPARDSGERYTVK